MSNPKQTSSSMTTSSSSSHIPARSRVKVSKLTCTACDLKNEAEMIHPILFVAICGPCHTSYKFRDRTITSDNNEASCLWCGEGDNIQLLFCDTCPYSYCKKCIQRNFGLQEYTHVNEIDVWSCYVCCNAPILQDIQHKDLFYYNLDIAYSLVKPPSDPSHHLIPETFIHSLSTGEKQFASLFTNQIWTSSLEDLKIINYFQASDLFGILFRISKKLRYLFQVYLHITPGLFQTPYGSENMCSLHFHQITSLKALRAIEEQQADVSFGSLRGGIFADEPGLGKTVTTLALISSTAGTLPQIPREFWEIDKVRLAWKHSYDLRSSQLSPIYTRLKQIVPWVRLPLPPIDTLTRLTSIDDFEHQVKHALKATDVSVIHKSSLLTLFRHEMSLLKARLNPESRVANLKTSRSAFERSLIPSSATLIIVPLTLLEHWHEQIKRHLEISYFANPEDPSGVVYFYGLGDMVDIQTPFANSTVPTHKPSIPLAQLASYTIVITTIEQCAMEHFQLTEEYLKQRAEHKRSDLLSIRWLRIVVDEGHDLGQLSPEKALSQSIQFIFEIAAERRWIMSGTPTIGSKTQLGLQQLFNLLAFLRHPKYFPTNNTSSNPSTASNPPNTLTTTTSTSSSNSINVPNNSTNTSITRIKPSKNATSTPLSFAQLYSQWKKQIILPCLEQNTLVWQEIIQLLKQILVRHTKSDINLFEPIYQINNLQPISLPEDYLQTNNDPVVLAEDRAKAQYIIDLMEQSKMDYKQARRTSLKVQRQSYHNLSHWSGDVHTLSHYTPEEKQLLFASRKPKAIVFSQHSGDLQGVGHFLYLQLGDASICEHVGAYQSSELSRFRLSERKSRCCPICGYANAITCEKFCEQSLYLIEYLPQAMDLFYDRNVMLRFQQGNHAPAPGGHGANGPGGHFVGRCLCSSIGCLEMSPMCLPNPFYTGHVDVGLMLANPNFALVCNYHIRGWEPGRVYSVDDQVYIQRADANDDPKLGFLWSQGRMGGPAKIIAWKKCMGRTLYNSWIGSRYPLTRVPWTIQEEDAMILMLEKDGSVGLDLSFATHIFLLERIKDPALRNQIISRAHRVGARGPVSVHLLQVSQEVEEETKNKELEEEFKSDVRRGGGVITVSEEESEEVTEKVLDDEDDAEEEGGLMFENHNSIPTHHPNNIHEEESDNEEEDDDDEDYYQQTHKKTNKQIHKPNKSIVKPLTTSSSSSVVPQPPSKPTNKPTNKPIKPITTSTTTSSTSSSTVPTPINTTTTTSSSPSPSMNNRYKSKIKKNNEKISIQTKEKSEIKSEIKSELKVENEEQESQPIKRRRVMMSTQSNNNQETNNEETKLQIKSEPIKQPINPDIKSDIKPNILVELDSEENDVMIELIINRKPQREIIILDE